MGMFSKQKNIIFISQSRLRAARVGLARTESVVIITDVLWNKETLLSLLSDIRTKIGDDIRIVLGEDLGYVASFSLKESAEYTRATIKEEASGYIPENLDEVAWDFQSIAALVGDKRISVSKGVQVAAVSKVFLHDIAPVFVEAGFVVEALETESCALARLMRLEDAPVLIVYEDNGRNLLVILERGVVMATESLPVSVSSDHIERLITSAQKHFFLRIASIVFSSKLPETFSEVSSALQGKGFQVKTTVLDPMVGVAKKNDIKGDDEHVLNVNILPKQKRSVLGFKLNTHKGHMLKIVFTFFVCSLLMVTGIFFFKRSWYSKTPVVVSEVVESVSPQEASTEAKVSTSQEDQSVVAQQSEQDVAQNTSDYTLQILNGSGEKGAAARVEKLLPSEGITSVSIGNADNARYVKTHIRVKTTVPQSLASALLYALSAAYVTEGIETLDDAAENDIIIIVGSQKNKHS